MAFVENTPSVTLEDRLKHGCVSLKELCALHLCGMTQVYADIKAGALEVEKHGRSTRVRGPIAREYVPGARRRKPNAA